MAGRKGNSKRNSCQLALVGSGGLGLGSVRAHGRCRSIYRRVNGLLFTAIFAGIRLPRNLRYEGVAKYLAAAIVVSILLTVAWQVTENAYKTLTVGSEPSSTDQVRAALGLESLGLHAGNKVAVIGYGYLDHWARLGRFRIVAEAASAGEAREFWASSPAARDLANESLEGTGAQAVVAWQPPNTALDPRWKKVASTEYYVYFLQK